MMPFCRTVGIGEKLRRRNRGNQVTVKMKNSFHPHPSSTIRYSAKNLRISAQCVAFVHFTVAVGNICGNLNFSITTYTTYSIDIDLVDTVLFHSVKVDLVCGTFKPGSPPPPKRNSNQATTTIFHIYYKIQSEIYLHHVVLIPFCSRLHHGMHVHTLFYKWIINEWLFVIPVLVIWITV